MGAFELGALPSCPWIMAFYDDRVDHPRPVH